MGTQKSQTNYEVKKSNRKPVGKTILNTGENSRICGEQYHLIVNIIIMFITAEALGIVIEQFVDLSISFSAEALGPRRKEQQLLEEGTWGSEGGTEGDRGRLERRQLPRHRSS